jgi:hypothetical protein
MILLTLVIFSKNACAADPTSYAILELSPYINLFSSLKKVPFNLNQTFEHGRKKHILHLSFSLLDCNVQSKDNQNVVVMALKLHGAVIRRHGFEEQYGCKTSPLMNSATFLTFNNDSQFNLVDYGFPCEDVSIPVFEINWEDKAIPPLLLKFNVGQGLGNGSTKKDIVGRERSFGDSTLTFFDGPNYYKDDTRGICFQSSELRRGKLDIFDEN